MRAYPNKHIYETVNGREIATLDIVYDKEKNEYRGVVFIESILSDGTLSNKRYVESYFTNELGKSLGQTLENALQDSECEFGRHLKKVKKDIEVFEFYDKLNITSNGV
jgi:hypothetical protein